jgi:hypothetical protein
MVQVDFSEEERWRREMASRNSVSGGMSGWFIKFGFAKDEKQANQVMVIILVGVLAVTAILALIGLEVI